MKWNIITFFLILILRLNAVGQIESHGTIVVINSSQNEIVFAADGRSAKASSYSDDDCKISAFGNKVVFAASGRRGLWNRSTRSYEWDAYTLARKEFRSFTSKGTPQSVVEQFASSWGIAMKKELEIDIAADQTHALANVEDDHVLALGAFAEFKRDKTFLIVIEKITYEITANGKVIVKAFVDHRITNPESYYIGKGEIIRELDAAQTPRSREWRRDFDMGLGFSSDPIVFEATKLVRLTIDNYPPTRTDSKGKKFSIVGGPIAVARFTPKGVEWVEKGNCPQK